MKYLIKLGLITMSILGGLVINSRAGLITHTDYVTGAVITAAGQNTNENAIFNEFNGSINTSNIAASGVGTTNIAANAVTAAKIADNTITAQQFDSNLQYGWLTSTMTWTYLTASTFTITGDWTDRFQTGDKVKLTQTTVKYFYVCKSTFVAATGLTNISVSGGTDYTLANAAITTPFWSHANSPTGFPQTFSYTPTFSAGWGTVSAVTGRFTLRGDRLTMFGKFTNGTVTAGVGTITLPAGLAVDSTKILVGDFSQVGTYWNFPGAATLAFGVNTAIFEISGAGTFPVLITMSYSAAAGSFTPNGVNGAFTNSTVGSFSAEMPVVGF